MVKWTRHAKAQLRQIHKYIAEDSPLYARRMSEEMVKKTMGLDEVPNHGRVVQELKDENVREIPIYSYRIIY